MCADFKKSVEETEPQTISTLYRRPVVNTSSSVGSAAAGAGEVDAEFILTTQPLDIDGPGTDSANRCAGAANLRPFLSLPLCQHAPLPPCVAQPVEPAGRAGHPRRALQPLPPRASGGLDRPLHAGRAAAARSALPEAGLERDGRAHSAREERVPARRVRFRPSNEGDSCEHGGSESPRGRVDMSEY